ncbi:hypothetical protein MAR_034249 [Mya arenaria]|uniref:Uncharacterized protein n=1 Tax=Mya arenaria TaxID=6604 RepID=A0ABY7GED4_MYAAR|nr:hypothetical protein MAR_034249 [Mya arenaria]
MDNIASLFTIIHPPALSGIPMLASSNKHSIHFREFQFCIAPLWDQKKDSPILDFYYYTAHMYDILAPSSTIISPKISELFLTIT